MPLPSGVKFEIEFTAGVWTDVTADVDYTTGISIHVGRTSPQEQPQVSSVTVQLRNPTGKYTPYLQVLTTGAAAPNYPNVVIRKRLRYSTTAGVRWLGSIKSWYPTTNGFPGSAMCVVSASDLMDALADVQMDTAIRQEVLIDHPSLYWPLTDNAGSSAALEQSGNLGAALTIVNPTQAALIFGDTGPGAGDGTGVKFAPTGVVSGQYLSAPVPDRPTNGAPYTVECWVNPGTTVPVWTTENVIAWLGSGVVIFLNNGLPWVTVAGAINLQSFTSIVDGGWHHLVVTDTGPAAGQVTFYVDGVVAATAPSSLYWSSNVFTLTFGEYGSGSQSRYQGNAAHVAVYGTALSAARVAAHFNSGRGWPAETPSTRIARFLGYAGLSAADWNLDTSSVALGSYPQAGKDVLGACQDMAITEGGGSAFYVLGGKARFTNRQSRIPAAPALTIDARLDVDRGAYRPGVDDQTLANSSTASRSTESGVQSALTAVDAASELAYREKDRDVTTYTATDADALALAQSIVAEGRAPGFRLPQITVDLLTATHNLYASVLATEIGSRIRVSSLPVGSAPATQLDVIAEGWTDTINVGTYTSTYDTSPADNPARFVWDDPAYGRWNPEADCALNAAITNSATTLVITCPTGPTFSTAPGDYPLNIKVGEEIITLTAPPAGAVSPQTFTGCTRGVNGTAPAAQLINARVQLWPAGTWTL